MKTGKISTKWYENPRPEMIPISSQPNKTKTEAKKTEGKGKQESKVLTLSPASGRHTRHDVFTWMSN
jgi:hypothetical protein